jgi:hypothetical protein
MTTKEGSRRLSAPVWDSLKIFLKIQIKQSITSQFSRWRLAFVCSSFVCSPFVCLGFGAIGFGAWLGGEKRMAIGHLFFLWIPFASG